QFAAAEIKRELSRKRIPVRKGAPTRVVLSVKPGGGEAQAYTIRKQSAGGRTVFAAEGEGLSGAIYAGLDIAEAIRLGALADLERTTVRFEDLHHTGVDMGSPEIFANLETVRRMPIADKIRSWRDVMQYAHDRAIEVLLFTWNIFTWGADGKYGITWDQ